MSRLYQRLVIYTGFGLGGLLVAAAGVRGILWLVLSFLVGIPLDVIVVRVVRRRIIPPRLERDLWSDHPSIRDLEE